jgi:RNA recognition motif-containing protein
MTEFMSRTIHVRFDRSAVDEADDSNTIKVFVGNLPWDFTDIDLERYFKDHPPWKFRVMTK